MSYGRINTAFVCGWSLCLIALCGCSGCGDPASSAQEIAVETPTGEKLIVHMNGTVPSNVVSSSGEQVRFTAGQAKVGENLVIVQPDGKIKVLREPRALMNDIWRLPTPYLVDGTLELVVMDPQDRDERTEGQHLWRALACRNPGCTGQGDGEHPFLFNAQGRSRAGDTSSDAAEGNPEQGSAALPCPACGSANHVVEYQLPDSARRKAELLAELARTRAARDRAAASH